MALGNFTFTSTAYQIQSDALVYVSEASNSFLYRGDVNTTADAQAARFLTMEERRIFEDMPALEVASSTVQVLAGNKTITLPANAYGCQIDKLFYGVNDNWNDNQTIVVLSQDEGEDRPGWLLNSGLQSANQLYAYWNPTRTALELGFEVPEDTDFTVWYLGKPTTYTAANMVSGGGGTSSIPSEHIMVLSLALAGHFAIAQGLFKRKAELDRELKGEIKKLSRAMIYAAANWRGNYWHEKGFPRAQYAPGAWGSGIGSSKGFMVGTGR